MLLTLQGAVVRLDKDYEVLPEHLHVVGVVVSTMVLMGPRVLSVQLMLMLLALTAAPHRPSEPGKGSSWADTGVRTTEKKLVRFVEHPRTTVWLTEVNFAKKVQEVVN